MKVEGKNGMMMLFEDGTCGFSDVVRVQVNEDGIVKHVLLEGNSTTNSIKNKGVVDMLLDITPFKKD